MEHLIIYIYFLNWFQFIKIFKCLTIALLLNFPRKDVKKANGFKPAVILIDKKLLDISIVSPVIVDGCQNILGKDTSKVASNAKDTFFLNIFGIKMVVSNMTNNITIMANAIKINFAKHATKASASGIEWFPLVYDHKNIIFKFLQSI